MSTIAPVAVGVALAFTWNVAESHTQADTGVTPKIELTVEQAAEQAWASATPAIATGGSLQATSGRETAVRWASLPPRR